MPVEEVISVRLCGNNIVYKLLLELYCAELRTIGTKKEEKKERRKKSN